MVLYEMSLLPLVRKLASHGGLQVWYAENSANSADFDIIEAWYRALVELGPRYGYFPEASKSIFVLHPKHVEEAKEIFEFLGFKIVMGYRYLGGYIGGDGECEAHFREKVETWRECVTRLGRASTNFPQSVYAGISQSLQHEWMFIPKAPGSR